MITAIMLALAYWILGLLFALVGFCALGCMTGLFLAVLYSFKSPIALWYILPLAMSAFVSLGVCWLIQWSSITLGNDAGKEMQYWFIVGAIVPGLLGFGFVPKITGMVIKAAKRTTQPVPDGPTKNLVTPGQ